MKVSWTKPYYGVQHTNKDNKGRWATVTDHNSFAVLRLNIPEQVFSGKEIHKDTVDEAKRAAEEWLRSVNSGT